MDVDNLKARVSKLGVWVKEAALNLLDDFKEQTVYFKQRVAVISGYVGIVVLTLVFAPVGQASNPIDAEIKATAIPWGLREKTVIEVRNTSSDDYQNLVVTVEGQNPSFEGSPASQGRWTFSTKTLRAGGELQLESKHFHDDKGLAPNIDVIPARVQVQCEDGRYENEVSLRRMH